MAIAVATILRILKLTIIAKLKLKKIIRN